MADTTGAEAILADCESYWLETGVPADAVAEMRAELASHLRDAAEAGKRAEAVVGPDLRSFAEEWAREYRGPGVPYRSPTPSVRTRSWAWPALGATFIATIVLGIIGPKEQSMDMDTWRWIWVGSAVALAVGEMVTAGFFLLPFAVGAASAAFLSFLNVAVGVQLVVFALVSVLTLVVLQRYARIEEEDPMPVGANRYLDAKATVLEAIDRVAGTGRVRMDTEEWRATTDLDETIPVGAEVRVIDVRGTRLVVTFADGGSRL